VEANTPAGVGLAPRLCWLADRGCVHAGALFFGEVMELPPCVLCWYSVEFFVNGRRLPNFGLAQLQDAVKEALQTAY
jgi:hypothetical protein